MKTNIRKLSIFLSVAVSAALIFTGCSDHANGQSSTQSPTMETVASTQEAAAIPTGEMALFDSFFLSTVEGRTDTQLEKFMDAASKNGFTVIEEAGVVLILDPNYPECYLRGELSHEAGTFVDALVYSRFLGDVERQVRADSIGTGSPVYYVGGNNFEKGNQVQSAEEVREYLVSKITPEETTTAAPEVALAMYENILLPLAEGTLDNQAAAIHSALEQYEFIYRDGEGLFSIYDSAAPENYLFGMPLLLEDSDTIDTLGFHWETENGSKEVEIYFFTSTPEYYVTSSEGRVQVSSLEELRAFIEQ